MKSEAYPRPGYTGSRAISRRWPWGRGWGKSNMADEVSPFSFLRCNFNFPPHFVNLKTLEEIPHESIEEELLEADGVEVC